MLGADAWPGIFKNGYLLLELEGGCGETLREECSEEDRGRSAREPLGPWAFLVIVPMAKESETVAGVCMDTGADTGAGARGAQASVRYEILYSRRKWFKVVQRQMWSGMIYGR